jgi:TRAP transporter 4TM/12TM fusion protein
MNVLPDGIPSIQEESFSAFEEMAKTATPWYMLIIKIVAFFFTMFQLYTAGFGTLAPLQQRGVHLLFALILVFLIYRSSKKSRWFRLLDFLLIGASIVSVGYVVVQSRYITITPGIYAGFEVVFAAIALFLILEACRRTSGISIPIACGLFLVYAFFGHLLPPPFGHRLYSFERVVSFIYYTTEGTFGVALSVSTNYIFIFVLFGVLYTIAGGGDLIVGLASAVLGHVRGGPAKIAVIGSCLFGSISGIGAANVVATGSITIPLMKRLGYNSRFAAATEAAASSGGQIMPPIMGGAAFIMADILGVSYWRVVSAAILPSLLYYWAIFESVDFEAAKRNLRGLDINELPKAKDVLKAHWPLFIPVFMIVFSLGYMRQSPMRAGLYGVLSSLVIIAIKQRGSLKSRLLNFFDILSEGALKSVSVAMACAAVGTIVGVIMMSGIGFKLGSLATALSGGNVWILLVLAMVASLILGMGLPVTVCYLIVVFIVINPLITFGVPPLIAHFFALFFAVMSNVTPPFAVCAVAAAGLAGSHPMKTGILSFTFVVPSFIIAFSFISRPELLLITEGPFLPLLFLAAAALGITCFASGRIGYLVNRLGMVERLILIALTFSFTLGRNFYVIGVSLVVFIIIVVINVLKSRMISTAS